MSLLPFPALVPLVLGVLLAVAPPELRALQDLPVDPDQPLLLDAQDGCLDDLALLEGTLLANGIFDAARQHEVRAALEVYLAELSPVVSSLDTVPQRVVAIHNFMHTRVLTGTYQADCTQFARAIRDGDFNCVSATVLFHLLARPLGLAPCAVATPTHVFSRVRSAEGDIDVQTTCAAWFALTPAQRRQYELAQSPVAPSARPPREIGDLELLAKIYYNRGVRHLEAQRFAAAEHEFRRSLQLDPVDEAAQENLLAALNNWALQRSDEGDFANATDILLKGLAINPHYAPLQANDLHIHQRWAHDLCRAGRYAEAVALLAEGRQRQPTAPLYRDGPQAVYRLWAGQRVEQGDYAGAQQICAAAEQRLGGAAGAVEGTQLLVEIAGQLAEGGDPEAARELIAAGLAAAPGNARLEAMQQRLTTATR